MRPRFFLDPYFAAGLLAVVLAGAGYRHLRPTPTTPRPEVTHVAPEVLAELDLLGGGQRIGLPDARVHVVELADYQCPACAVAHRALWPVLERHLAAGRVRHTTYDLPLTGHANAIPAALVAGCVADAGPQAFWSARQRLFATQNAWADAYPAEPPLLAAVAPVGADTAGVRDCLSRSGAERAGLLRLSRETAFEAGLTYTPVWAVNGRIVPWEAVEEEIARALRSTRGSD